MKTPRELAKERKPFIDAFIDGGEVELRYLKGSRKWLKMSRLGHITDPDYEFRIKPKKLECWVNVYAHGNVHYEHFTTKSAAEDYAGNDATRVAVHMAEADD